MSNHSKLSLIILSKNEGHNLKQTIDHVIVTKSEVAYEIIVVDDGSSDKSTSFLKNNTYADISVINTKGVGTSIARNLGAEDASGEIYIFLDAHIIPQDKWLDNLVGRFERQDVVVVAPVLGAFNPAHPDVYGVSLDKKMQPFWVTEPIVDFSPVPFVGGGCLAIRSEIFHALGGFDEGMKSMGFADIDFILKLWMFGFNAYLDPNVRILHYFRKTKPYKVLPSDITYNFLRMAFKHFNEDRIAKAINVAKEANDFGNILMDILRSDVWEQRLDLQSKRKYDDDWFFEKFSLNF